MAKNDSPLPLPIVESTDQEVAAGAFPTGEPDPETPLGAAFIWWMALKDPVEYRNALDNLSINPSAWNGYQEAAEVIGHRSILTGVEDNPDDPAIKYIRFIEYAGENSGQVFEDAELDEFEVLTVVKPEGSNWWLIWGLSHNYFPPVSEIREG